MQSCCTSQLLTSITMIEPERGASRSSPTIHPCSCSQVTNTVALVRTLPHTRFEPGGSPCRAPHRRMTQVCAPGYLGRKRGEVIRTRTTVLQAFTHQWIGTYGGSGNGDYRAELKRALEAITWYALAHGLPLGQILVRLDGLYGN